jgi:hypothetical protein
MRHDLLGSGGSISVCTCRVAVQANTPQLPVLLLLPPPPLLLLHHRQARKHRRSRRPAVCTRSGPVTGTSTLKQVKAIPAVKVSAN